MKWRTEAEPQQGDRRNRTKFAFLPTKLSNGDTVWLERYRQTEHYHYVFRDTGWGSGEFPAWVALDRHPYRGAK